MSTSSSASSPASVPVFLSYSHRDEAWKDDLKRALASLSKYGHIIIWDDRKILAGTAWEPEIEQRLREALLVLLLVTENYVYSEWCRKECEIARDDPNRQVIPLFVKKVKLAAGDPILGLQGLPRDMKWADEWPAAEQNIPRAHIAEGITEILGGENRRRSIAPAAAANGVHPRFVDRETQEREFKDFWDVAAWSRPGAAQVYLLPAMEFDCPGYFVQRLKADTVERMARSLKGADKGAVDGVVVSREPRYQNLESLQHDVADDIFGELGALLPPAQLSAKPLATLDRLRLPAFFLIEQAIRADLAGPLLARLLDWYTGTFWAGFRSSSQVLVFLHLIYPAPARNWLQRLVSPRSPHQTQLQSCLRQAFPEGRANLVPDAAGAPVKVLPELAPVQLDDVKNLLSRFPDLPPDEVDRTARGLYTRVRKESGDTRLSYFCRPLLEFKDDYDRRQPRSTR